MRVSVAIATHNGARYLREQLDSILSQSVLPEEIVLSDDASSDDTVEIARSISEMFGRLHPQADLRVRILENARALGVTANFESAITACTGDVIFLADQDDRWHPDRVESAIREFLQHTNALLVCADARLVDGDGAAIGQSLFGALALTGEERTALAGGDTYRALMKRNLVTGATTAIRRDLLEFAAPFPASWVHDEWLAVIAATRRGVFCIPREVIDYRQHDENQIGARGLTLRDKVRRLMEPRSDRNRRLVERSDALVARLGDDAHVDKAFVAMARGKRDHELRRSGLPSARPGRVLPVVRELRAGGYRDYGRGVADAVRDLLQPVG